MANVVNGTNFRIYASGVAIGEATNCSMSLTVETRDTLTKDNVGSWTSSALGRRSGTLTSEGLIAFDTTNQGVDDLFTHYVSGTALEVRFRQTSSATAVPYWVCTAYITSLEFSAAVEENSTYSATWTITGAVSMAS